MKPVIMILALAIVSSAFAFAFAFASAPAPEANFKSTAKEIRAILADKKVVSALGADRAISSIERQS